MSEIPDGDWTCLRCGAGIQSSNRELFNILVDRHMKSCNVPLPRDGDDE